MTWCLWLSLQSYSGNNDGLGEMMGSETRKNLSAVADTLFHVLVYGKGKYFAQI